MSLSKSPAQSSGSRASGSESKPIQILGLTKQENIRYLCFKDSLNRHLDVVKDYEVAVIPVVGPSRKGKSFLLNYMCRYLSAQMNQQSPGHQTQWIGRRNEALKGFTWKADTARETEGIWISEPYLIERSDGTKLVVLLLDTQGVFDNTTSKRDWLTIVGISLMVASTTIFNVFSNIQDDTLIFMESFLEAGLTASNSMSSSEWGKPFQNLLFLVRDWEIVSRHNFGLCGGNDYLSYILQKSEDQSDSAQHARQLLKECFDTIECFLMPRIGDKMLDKNFNGSHGMLAMDFTKKLKELIVHILNTDDIEAKQINGKPITVKEFMELFNNLVHLFNKQDFQENDEEMSKLLVTISTTVADKLTIRKIKAQHLADFRDIINSKNYLSDKSLNEQRINLHAQYLVMFEDQIYPENYDSLKEHLDMCIQDNFNTVYEENKIKRKEFIDSIIVECKTRFRDLVGKEIENRDYQDLYEVEDKLKLIEQQVIQYLESRIYHQDLETVFKVELLTFMQYLANAKEESRARMRDQINGHRIELTKLITKGIEEYVNQMSYVLARVNMIEQDEYGSIEKKVRTTVMETLQSKLADTDPTTLLVSQVQLKNALKAKKEQFKSDYLAKVKRLQDLSEQMKKTAVDTYRENMNQFVNHFKNKEEFQRHHNIEMNRVGEDFRHKCSLSQPQVERQLEDLQKRLLECHNQFVATVEAKENLYRTAFQCAVDSFEQEKVELRQVDWVFEKLDMEKMRRILKGNAAKNFSTFFDSQRTPYHEYLFQLMNHIEESFNRYVEDIEVESNAIDLEYKRIGADLIAKFKNKYGTNLEPSRVNLSKEQLLNEYAKKGVKYLKFETKHNLNQAIEETLRVKFMTLLSEACKELDQEQRNNKRKAYEVIENVIKRSLDEYDQKMEYLIWENIVLDDDTFTSKERLIRQEIILEFGLKMMTDSDNKAKFEPQLVQSLELLFIEKSTLKNKNSTIIEALIERNLNEYRFEMERRLTLSKTRNDLTEFDKSLRSRCITSLSNALPEMPKHVQDSLECLIADKMDQMFVEFDNLFEFQFKENRRDIERKISELEKKFCTEFEDIERDMKCYPDEMMTMKIKSNKNQIMTEFTYFVNDKASDDIDNYLMNMNKIIDNCAKRLEKLNKDNRKECHDKIRAWIDALCDKYTSIMKDDVGSVKTEDELNKCHDSAYKQIAKDFENSQFADHSDRDIFKDRLKESLDSSKQLITEQIKQNLIKSYTQLIDEKLGIFINTIQTHVGDNETIDMLDNYFHLLKNKTVKEFSKSVSREFGTDVDSLVTQLEQSICTEYTKIKEQEDKRRADVIRVINGSLADYLHDYEENMKFEINNISNTNELQMKKKNVKDNIVEMFQKSHCKVLTKDDMNKFTNQLVMSFEQHYQAKIEPFWKAEEKRRQLTIDNLKTKVSAYYQDEINKHLVNNLYIEDKELMRIHSNLSNEIIKKFESDFESVPKTLYLNTLRNCTKGIFEKVREQSNMYKPKTSFAIGIDLGTTNSCVGYFHPSDQDKYRVIIIRSELNAPTTTSVVSIRDNGELVGVVAKEEIYAYPKNTVVSVKRLMGRKFSEEPVQYGIRGRHWQYEVVSGENDRAMIKMTVKEELKKYSPEVISAKILKKLKQLAQKQIGVEVTKAVITVPAYFTDAQKEATINAGKIAGLDVLKIINEPTAAAMAYRLNWGINTREKKIVVYDFGGGTFDVSVLVVTEGMLDVRAVGGDNQLGGDNFDTNLMNYCIDDFKQKNNITKISGDEGDRAMRCRLKLLCEKAKINLSASEESKITIFNFYDRKDLEIVVTREVFENMNKELVDRSIEILMKTLEESKIKIEDIDDVVLVGGTTRVPMIQTELKKMFGNKELNRSVNPDEAVAIGAAIQAAMLNEHQSLPMNKLKLSDVTPMSLGIELIGEKFSKIIAKNTKVPTRKRETYITVYDDQTEVIIIVYEGESDEITENNKLGSFILTDIPKARAGEQEILVTFDLNEEGLLHVSARVKSTGMEGEINIEATKGRLSDEDLEELIRKGV